MTVLLTLAGFFTAGVLMVVLILLPLAAVATAGFDL